jgi:hypothetical protein
MVATHWGHSASLLMWAIYKGSKYASFSIQSKRHLDSSKRGNKIFV